MNILSVSSFTNTFTDKVDNFNEADMVADLIMLFEENNKDYESGQMFLDKLKEATVYKMMVYCVKFKEHLVWVFIKNLSNRIIIEEED